MSLRSRQFPASEAAFTLLEICIVVLIAMLLMRIAIPSLAGVLAGNRVEKSFTEFDSLVQDAHDRAIAEQRAYVLIWSPKRVLLRPDEPVNKAEAEGLRELPIGRDDVLNLFLPASLATKKGKLTAAIWTFWPGGACEPATIAFKGKAGAWHATYNPFTVQAETRYE